MFSGIFKLMFDLVEDVINQIITQVKLVEDAVTAPLRNLVGLVTSGIWRGGGADKFVQEMQTDVIPMLLNIINVNNSYSTAIKNSVERMNAAEQQAAKEANTLMDVFGQIY